MVGLLGPGDLAGCGLPSETAGVAQFLRLGEIGLALSQSILGFLALGDVLAGDQHDWSAIGPQHGLGILAHP